MTNNNVVYMNGSTKPQYGAGEPRQDLIAMLERLLEDARSGTLQSFIGTGFMHDGFRLSVWADYHDNYYTMMGAVTELAHELRVRMGFQEV